MQRRWRGDVQTDTGHGHDGGGNEKIQLNLIANEKQEVKMRSYKNIQYSRRKEMEIRDCEK